MTAPVILFVYSYFNKLLFYLERVLLDILYSIIHEFNSCPQYCQAKRVHLHKQLSTKYYYTSYGSRRHTLYRLFSW